MFKKLVSNLPFQPSLLSEIAFYTNRLQKETAVRRLGVLLLLVGFSLQVFTISFPPQSSLATNRSDIVYGASSRSDVLSAYRRNEDQLGRKDIRAIYNHYGIGESQISNSKKVVVKDSDKNYINTSRSTTKWADTFVSIKGAVDGGIYEFPLEYWRKDEYPNGYPALTGITSYGYRFWILLKGCGNIVFEKGAKKPRLEIKKERTTGYNTTEGSTVKYEIKFRNSGALAANKVSIVDTLPNNLKFISQKSNIDLNFSKNGNTLKWDVKGRNNSLPATTKWGLITLTATATKPTIKKVCNSAFINASNSSKVTASEKGNCIIIAEKTCPGTGLPIPAGGIGGCVIRCSDGSELAYDKQCPIPQLTCSEMITEATGIWSKKDILVNLVSQPGAKVEKVELLVNNKVVSNMNESSSNAYSFTYDFEVSGKYSVQANVVAKDGEVQQSQHCSVVVIITKPEVQEVILVTDKSVTNNTQQIEDANNTTASASDSLTYNLTLTNKGNKVAENIELNGEYAEDVRDILEYADITNLYDGIFNKATGKISWSNVSIKPGEVINKRFDVKIKDPLPKTPISASNPLSYDFSMHNEYGKTVVVNLEKPISKSVEEVASTLPNTGPGATLTVFTLLVVVMSYFYFRSSLLSKELSIVQKEFQSGGY